jgi:2-polyprenyl-3-methyl-5-hydroxy-6-metoxy-1,4-benzoquinol methylase
VQFGLNFFGTNIDKINEYLYICIKGNYMYKSNEMEIYYEKRALEYENIYLKPERKEYIKKSKELLKKYFDNKNVLEISCGTGFWTETISEVAKNILAADLNTDVLEIAKAKVYNCKVEFIQDDSYKLDKIKEKQDSLFAGFWFSHIPKSKIKEFMDVIYSKLNENALIIFMDNLYVEENNTPISRFDTEGNSYQNRTLKDNSQYEVIKNFYEENELREYFNNYGKEIEITKLKYFWILKYIKK